MFQRLGAAQSNISMTKFEEKNPSTTAMLNLALCELWQQKRASREIDAYMLEHLVGTPW